MIINIIYWHFGDHFIDSNIKLNIYLQTTCYKMIIMLDEQQIK